MDYPVNDDASAVSGSTLASDNKYLDSPLVLLPGLQLIRGPHQEPLPQTEKRCRVSSCEGSPLMPLMLDHPVQDYVQSGVPESQLSGTETMSQLSELLIPLITKKPKLKEVSLLQQNTMQDTQEKQSQSLLPQTAGGFTSQSTVDPVSQKSTTSSVIPVLQDSKDYLPVNNPRTALKNHGLKVSSPTESQQLSNIFGSGQTAVQTVSGLKSSQSNQQASQNIETSNRFPKVPLPKSPGVTKSEERYIDISDNEMKEMLAQMDCGFPEQMLSAERKVIQYTTQQLDSLLAEQLNQELEHANTRNPPLLSDETRQKLSDIDSGLKHLIESHKNERKSLTSAVQNSQKSAKERKSMRAKIQSLGVRQTEVFCLYRRYREMYSKLNWEHLAKNGDLCLRRQQDANLVIVNEPHTLTLRSDNVRDCTGNIKSTVYDHNMGINPSTDKANIFIRTPGGLRQLKDCESLGKSEMDYTAPCNTGSELTNSNKLQTELWRKQSTDVDKHSLQNKDSGSSKRECKAHEVAVSSKKLKTTKNESTSNPQIAGWCPPFKTNFPYSNSSTVTLPEARNAETQQECEFQVSKPIVLKDAPVQNEAQSWLNITLASSQSKNKSREENVNITNTDLIDKAPLGPEGRSEGRNSCRKKVNLAITTAVDDETQEHNDSTTEDILTRSRTLKAGRDTSDNSQLKDKDSLPDMSNVARLSQNNEKNTKSSNHSPVKIQGFPLGLSSPARYSLPDENISPTVTSMSSDVYLVKAKELNKRIKKRQDLSQSRNLQEPANSQENALTKETSSVGFIARSQECQTNSYQQLHSSELASDTSDSRKASRTVTSAICTGISQTDGHTAVLKTKERIKTQQGSANGWLCTNMLPPTNMNISGKKQAATYPTLKMMIASGDITPGGNALTTLVHGKTYQASLTPMGCIQAAGGEAFKTPMQWLSSLLHCSVVKKTRAYQMVKYKGEALAAFCNKGDNTVLQLTAKGNNPGVPANKQNMAVGSEINKQHKQPVDVVQSLATSSNAPRHVKVIVMDTSTRKETSRFTYPALNSSEGSSLKVNDKGTSFHGNTAKGCIKFTEMSWETKKEEVTRLKELLKYKIRLISDTELQQCDDLPDNFWSEDFTEVRVDADVWMCVNQW